MEEYDDLQTLILSQRSELMAAEALSSDLDLAYQIQLQEAMAASLSSNPSSSSSSSQTLSLAEPPSPDLVISLQTQELDRFQQESLDAHLSKQQMHNFLQASHDAKFAREICEMPKDMWEDRGDEFEMPLNVKDCRVRVYFKGLESMETVSGRNVNLAGVGVAVCDERDEVLVRISKGVDGAAGCREMVEMRALVEAFNAVVGVGWRKIDLFMDYRTLYNHVTGIWAVKQKKHQNSINQIQLLQRKLDECNILLVPRCDIKHAFKLARDAIDSQVARNLNSEQNSARDVKECCKICLEDTEPSQMFVVDDCLHRFCFSCMKQHVEVKLLHGMLPTCPHEACKIKLKVENCQKFLTPNLLNIMVQRVKEESIPVTQKIYCPYPKCSALMSWNEAIKLEHGSSSKQPAYGTAGQSGLRKCVRCDGSFCIYCKVPWHSGMSCAGYHRLNPKNAEEHKLKALARQKLWRQCIKCSHMIELAEGCYHMTCRCGYEFCYTCGAEWKEKKATCSCPLWEEGNILYDDPEPDHFDEDDFDEDDDDITFEELARVQEARTYWEVQPY